MLSINPQVRHVIVHRWNEELEKRARRCRGCGEWNFADYCEWCADMCDTTTYSIRWTGNVNGWAVLCEGRVVHRASSLLEAENWVTRGGADTYELSNACSTMGASDTPADAGGRGTVGAAPDLAEPVLEVRHAE